MDDINTLEIGTELANAELQAIFKCSPQGGMRRSHETNTLVIVSNLIKSIYKDRHDEETSTLYYTGMGTTGDQSLSFAQNKTLADSNTNGVTVHWFEVLEDKVYTYRGIVTLANKPLNQIGKYTCKSSFYLVYNFMLHHVPSTSVNSNLICNNFSIMSYS